MLCLLFTLVSCSGMYYHPSPTKFYDPKDFGLEYEIRQFQSKDGTQLHGWYLPAENSKGLILFYHGNAENISSHFLNLAWITRFNYDVFIFDYRGYGRSGGNPHPEGIYYDSLAALEYAQKLNRTNRLIVYGQSLGGNIAFRAVQDSSVKVDELILDSTFLSYQDMAFEKLTEIWPLIPFSPLAYLLFNDHYASARGIDKLQSMRSLVIHGEYDKIVPLKFGKEVFEKLKASRKLFWSIPKGRHTDIFHRENKIWRKKFLDYLNSKS